MRNLTRADDSKRLLDELVARSLAYRTSDEFRALLDFVCKFPHIAPFNAMLLHMQNPGVQFALSALNWERQYRRRVLPGRRPYVILRTMGPVDFVFEITDTEPIDDKSPPLPSSVFDPFPAKGDPPPDTVKKLVQGCARARIKIEERDLGAGRAGSIERVRRPECDFLLILNKAHTVAQKIGTHLHELGHVFCGHMGQTAIGFWSDRSSADQAAKEFEAESVAYLVTQRMGIEIGSESYLAGYLTTNTPLPNYSLESILKAAGKVEEVMSGKFRVRTPKKKQQQPALRAVAPRALPGLAS